MSKSEAITDQHIFKKYEEITYKSKYVYTHTPSYIYTHKSLHIHIYIKNTYFNIHISTQKVDHNQWLPQATVLRDKFQV